MNNKREFVSSLTLPKEEVSQVLNRKINEERKNVKNNRNEEAILFEKELFKNENNLFQTNVINTVSLFSGAGGLDLGVELAGISTEYGVNRAYEAIKNQEEFYKLRGLVNIIYSNDLFGAANKSYKNNIASGTEMISDSRDIRKVYHFPNSDLMLGGFPCPGFSVAGPRLLDDPRNFLYIHYIRALVDSKPAVFVAENVKGLMTMAKGQVLKQIKEDFSAAGYKVYVNLVNARDYGVPQSRERVFIVGIRNDIVEDYQFEYKLPTPTNGPNTNKPFVTLRDAIGDLPENPDDVFDATYSSMYMSRNRKKAWDDQSFTIQASGRQAPQYPGGEPMEKVSKDKWRFTGNLNRRLSVRECARIQTFPDWFRFSDDDKENVTKNNRLNEQYKQIGNAVPVYLAEKITRPIIELLYKHPEILINHD